MLYAHVKSFTVKPASDDR